MFLSNLRLAIKSILREAQQSAISVFGLAVALSCSILILLYVQYEMSYDNFHEKKENIYRIVTTNSASNSYMGKNVATVTPAPLKEVLKSVPGVENSARCKFFQHTIEYNSALFSERGFLYADPDFLRIFSFPASNGNPYEALNEPFTLFMTKRMAVKYFGDEDPLGKTVMADNKYLFTVRGILENIPENSHLKFDFLSGFETFYSIRGGKEKVETWTSLSYITYIRLSDNSDKEDIKVRLEEFPSRYLPKEPIFENMRWVMIPVKDIHLGGNANFEPGKNNDIRYLYLIISIGVFILLIACFNFMNIATARALGRGLETAVLKVSGCSKKELIIRFFSESLLLSFIGLLLALVIIGSVLPMFGVFTERSLNFMMIFEFPTLIWVILLTFLTGIISNLYPAFYLSAMSPVYLMKGEHKKPGSGRRTGMIRNLVVVLQYIISIVALVCTLAMLKQLNYLKNADTGFIEENVLTISVKDPAIRRRPDPLISELKNQPGIADVTLSSYLPHAIYSSTFINWEGKPEERHTTAFRNGIGTNFIDFYNLEIVSGRGYSNDFSADSASSYIINQTAAKLTGIDDPVGKKFGCNGQTGTIIGVVKDFNFQPLHLAIEPLAFSVLGSKDFPEAAYMSVKVKSGNLNDTRLLIEKILKEISPHYLNPISVLSEDINAYYRSESKLSVIFIAATVISVLLTCLGQYSLSTYTTKSRVKEMVIRKIMGSQPAEITILLFHEMARWIIISVLFAWPVAYLLMDKWLQNFAFHADPGIGVFLLSLLITLSMSIISVSYHIMKLSKVNPAEVIRVSN